MEKKLTLMLAKTDTMLLHPQIHITWIVLYKSIKCIKKGLLRGKAEKK